MLLLTQIDAGVAVLRSTCADMDPVLCIARVVPSFLLTLFDTGLFYSVRSCQAHVPPTDVASQ